MNQKNTAKDTKMTKMIIVAILILSIGGGVMLIYLSSIEESSVFNIPYNSESAWKNAQFHSMLLFRTLLLPDSMYQTTELDLAEEFSILNDGLTYRVTIKEGIVWSNGEPLTIEDVVFSIESSLKAKDTNGIYTLAFSKIVGYEDFIDNVTDHLIGLEVSGQTVTIQLTSLYPSMEQILAQFVIVPKHILEQEEVTMLNYNEFWENPVVSGMYKVEEVTEEVVTLVKNERYIGEEPLIETIKMHTNYQQELLDYFSTNNISDITNYRIKVGVEEYLTSSLFYRYFIFNMQGIDGNENEAMQDVRVRKAIAYAINRENIIEHIYENTTTIINSGIPDSHYAVSRDSIEYDPEMAKQLLEEAGYDFERPLVLAYYYADNVSESFMYAVANDLRAVGFQVELRLIETADEMYYQREYDMVLKGLAAFSISEWYAEYDNENPSFAQIFGGDTLFEPYVEALATESDINEVNNILVKLQELEHEEFYKLPLFTLNQYVYINRNRVNIPENVEFGNSWYRNDVEFEKWNIQ